MTAPLSTRLHEGGHAVLSVRCGLTVDGIDLTAGEFHAATTTVPVAPADIELVASIGALHLLDGLPPAAFRYGFARIVIALAGDLAAETLAPPRETTYRPVTPPTGREVAAVLLQGGSTVMAEALGDAVVPLSDAEVARTWALSLVVDPLEVGPLIGWAEAAARRMVARDATAIHAVAAALATTDYLAGPKVVEIIEAAEAAKESRNGPR